MDNFAFTLRIARMQQRLTQEQLAYVADVSNVTISHIETGISRPNDDTKQKIEQVLGPIDWQRTFDESKIKRHILTN